MSRLAWDPGLELNLLLCVTLRTGAASLRLLGCLFLLLFYLFPSLFLPHSPLFPGSQQPKLLESLSSNVQAANAGVAFVLQMRRGDHLCLSKAISLSYPHLSRNCESPSSPELSAGRYHFGTASVCPFVDGRVLFINNTRHNSNNQDLGLFGQVL